MARLGRGTPARPIFVRNASSTATNVNLAGVVADVAITAPAGTVTVTSNATVAGVVADTAITAPAGTVTVTASVTVVGVVADMALGAPAGSVNQTVEPAAAGGGASPLPQWHQPTSNVKHRHRKVLVLERHFLAWTFGDGVQPGMIISRAEHGQGMSTATAELGEITRSYEASRRGSPRLDDEILLLVL